MVTKRLALGVAATVAALLVAACSSSDPGSQLIEFPVEATPTLVAQERYALQQALDFTITLTTTSVGGTFGRLDRAHSCERNDTSPQISWEGVPEGAESLALVMEDPTSDTLSLTIDVLWAHWVLYSIPPNVTELEAGQAAGETLENGARQGTNDYERVQYNGPCPIPSLVFPNVGGGGRRQSRPNMIAEDRPYYFKLYALDRMVDLALGADRDTLLETIDGHILAAGELAVPYKSVNGYPCRSTNPEIYFETLQRR